MNSKKVLRKYQLSQMIHEREISEGLIFANRSKIYKIRENQYHKNSFLIELTYLNFLIKSTSAVNGLKQKKQKKRLKSLE